MAIREKQLSSTFTGTIVREDGSNAFTGDQSMGSNKLTNLAIGTSSTDALSVGQLTWKEPVAVLQLVGNAAETTIEGLSPSDGDAYEVSAVDGDSTIDGTAAAIGDIFEYDGALWQKIVTNSGGYVPADTRAVLATQTALIAPYTDATDDGKIVKFSGSSNTGADTSEAIDGYSVIVNGVGSFFENKGYVFDGTVATGTWSQFTGAGQITAGAGLTKSGDTLNVGDASKGIQVNANDLEFSASEAVEASGGLKAGSNAWELAVEPNDFAGTGLEDDGSDNLRLASQGNGILGGAGSTLSVDPDSETGGNTQPVSVGADGVGVDINAVAGTGIEADGSANLRLAAQGTGIAGGAGNTLSIDTTSTVTFAGAAWTFPADDLQITGTPDSANDGVNKAYVDSQITGLQWRAPVDSVNLIGNVDLVGLVGNAAETVIEGLTPAASDAYTVSAVDGDSTIDGVAAAVGDIFQYNGANWKKVVTNSGGFPPINTYCMLSTTETLIAPYAASTVGDRAYFNGASLTASAEVTPASGDSYVVEGTDANSLGSLMEWSGSAWVELQDGVGGFVANGVRAIVGITPSSTLIAPYAEATDDGKLVDFDGTTNTGANTSEATDGSAVLASDSGHVGVNDSVGYVFEGTVPTGSWTQFTGAGQINAGTGLSKAGNTLNVGDAGKGIQVNVSDLEFSAAEAVEASGGLKAGSNAWELTIEPNDFAGTGLEDDGSDNLRVAAQGNGLTGGAGSTLSVQADGTSVSVGASGIKAAVPTTGDKEQQSAATSGNGSTTGITIAATPSGDGSVEVALNGIQVVLGNGVKTKDCYFSVDGGTTARAISAITAGDTLYWNGAVVTFDLDTSDYLDFNYNIA
jgi:hypothetical protein